MYVKTWHLSLHSVHGVFKSWCFCFLLKWWMSADRGPGLGSIIYIYHISKLSTKFFNVIYRFSCIIKDFSLRIANMTKWFKLRMQKKFTLYSGKLHWNGLWLKDDLWKTISRNCGQSCLMCVLDYLFCNLGNEKSWILSLRRRTWKRDLHIVYSGNFFLFNIPISVRYQTQIQKDHTVRECCRLSWFQSGLKDGIKMTDKYYSVHIIMKNYFSLCNSHQHPL